MLRRHFRGDLRLLEGERNKGVNTYAGGCFSPLGVSGGLLNQTKVRPNRQHFTSSSPANPLVTLQAFCMKCGV